jgi:hypothetical protein
MMSRRRIIFAVLLLLMFAAIWRAYRTASEASSSRESIKRVPSRVADLSVPMSAFWEAKLALPQNAGDLKPFGLLEKALGAQPDGTVLEMRPNGVIDVTVKAVGNDAKAGRMAFFPIVNIAAAAPTPRISKWQCITDNFPGIAEFISGCRFVGGVERMDIAAQHQANIERTALAMKPPPALSPEAIVALPNEANPLSGSTVALSSQEVEQALKSGKSLEAALAEKRRNARQAPTEPTR